MFHTHRAIADIPLRNVGAAKSLAAVARVEQINVPMNNLGGRAIEHINIVVAAGIGAHAATTAGAGGLVKVRSLRRKSLAIVGRTRHPYAPVPLAFSSRGRRVPEHVDIARAVGGDRATTVETVSSMDQIALGLEPGPGVIETRKQHGMLHPCFRSFGTIKLVCTVPGDIDPSISAEGHV